MACLPNCNLPDPPPALCFGLVHFQVSVYFRTSVINSDTWNTGSSGHTWMYAPMFGIYVWGSHLPLNGGSKILPNVVTFLTKLHGIMLHKLVRGKAIPLQVWTGPEGSRFQDTRHMKVVRSSTLRTIPLYRQEIFLVLIFVRKPKCGRMDYVNEKF
jgi:hypothetical protein